MAIEVRVPTTGNAGEDAVVSEWHVERGAQVTAGVPLVTLETAKSSIDIDASADGVLLARHAEVGDEIGEFAVIATIAAVGELTETPAPSDDEPQRTDTSRAERVPAASVASAPRPSRSDRPAISPRARRLAAQLGVPVEQIRGSGPLGRVIERDVAAGTPDTAAAAVQPPTSTSTSSAGAVRPTEPGGRLVPVTGARKVTAERMHASLAQTAQVTLTRYADARRLLKWVKRLRAASDDASPRIGVNELVMQAVAHAARDFPRANSWWEDEGIREFGNVHLGFAVATGQALLVPVVDDAEGLSVRELAAAVADAKSRAFSGRVTADEMRRGTITVSNLGSLGIHWFTPVLNTPQNCIVGVGALDGREPRIPLSLTFDHRALDGAEAAAFLAQIATNLAGIDTLDALRTTVQEGAV